MQGPIAQALALTCVGNAFLRGRDVSGFWPNASVFQFSRSCDFRKVDGERDDLIAADPLAWFETLRSFSGLRLHTAPRPRTPQQSITIEERMSVGFVGGGPAWIIEVAGRDNATLWQGYDRLGDRDDPERKIWLNTYLMSGATLPQTLAVLPLEAAAQELDAGLIEIEALAVAMAAGWDENFREARATLSAAEPNVGYHADIAGYAGFDLKARQILGAVSQAWVFGGMGSWNDIGGPDAHAQDYERISERLFRALIDALCALANSTCQA